MTINKLQLKLGTVLVVLLCDVFNHQMQTLKHASDDLRHTLDLSVWHLAATKPIVLYDQSTHATTHITVHHHLSGFSSPNNVQTPLVPSEQTASYSVIVIKQRWKSPLLIWGFTTVCYVCCVCVCVCISLLLAYVFIHCILACMCGQSVYVCVPRKTQLLTTSFKRMETLRSCTESNDISYGDTKCIENLIG